MALDPITWSAQRKDAGYYLVATSNLCEHDHFLETVKLDYDGIDQIDIAELQQWGWSSGEKTLVDLFLFCAGYSTGVTLRDVMNLDRKNLTAAANTISMLAAPADGWQF